MIFANASVRLIVALSIALLACVSAIAQTESDGFSYVRLFVDDEGVSHFEDITVAFESQDFAPPAAPLGVSESWLTDSLLFIRQSFGWNGDWHPTPRRQFAILLTGTQEVMAGDGEVRSFGPGDVVLLEDTTGRGHVSKIISSEGSVVMMVPLPPE